MTIHCSFCLRPQHEVKRIVIAVDTAAICDDCVAVCVDALKDPEPGVQHEKVG